MSNIGLWVPVVVPDIEQVLVDFTTVRTYARPSRTGAPALISTQTLVSGTRDYSFQDTAATENTWYQTQYYNTVSGATSQLSEPLAGAGSPLVGVPELRQRTAHRAGVYMLPPRQWRMPRPSGTTTPTSTASALVCAEYSSSLYADKSYMGASLLLLGGTYAGEERQVSELNPAGSFAMADNFSGAPGVGITFEGYIGGVTSGDLIQALNEAFLSLWVPARVPIVGVRGQTEYGVPYFLSDVQGQSLGLSRRTGTTARGHAFVGGYDYIPQVGGENGDTLYLPAALAENEVRYLQTYRNPPPILTDADTFLMSDQMVDLLCVSAVTRLVDHLSNPVFGEILDFRSLGDWRVELERDRKALLREHPGYKSTKLRQGTMVSISNRLW